MGPTMAPQDTFFTFFLKFSTQKVHVQKSEQVPVGLAREEKR